MDRSVCVANEGSSGRPQPDLYGLLRALKEELLKSEIVDVQDDVRAEGNYKLSSNLVHIHHPIFRVEKE